jgi:hypothetical protein
VGQSEISCVLLPAACNIAPAIAVLNFPRVRRSPSTRNGITVGYPGSKEEVREVDIVGREADLGNLQDALVRQLRLKSRLG